MGIPVVSSMDKKNMLPYTGKRHGSSMGFLNQLNFFVKSLEAEILMGFFYLQIPNSAQPYAGKFLVFLSTYNFIKKPQP